MQKLLFGWFLPFFSGKPFKTIEGDSNSTDLEMIGGWLASGSLTVDIDSVHDIGEFASAWERFGDRSKQGRVVGKVRDGW